MKTLFTTEKSSIITHNQIMEPYISQEKVNLNLNMLLKEVGPKAYCKKAA
jgi:hypothetical protein